MSRQSLEDWGAELAEGEFAKAVAALGVTVRRQSLPWPGDFDLAAGLAAWAASEPQGARVVPWSAPTPAECAAVSAAQCAAAWPAKRIQLEIREPDLDPFWLAETLGHWEVGASAVYVRSDRAGLPLTWNWPLRIGLAPAAAHPEVTEFAEFEERLALTTATVDWWDTLTRIVGLDRNRNVCDLLVLPVGLEAAVAALEVQRSPIAAGSVVALGGSGDLSWQEARAALESLRSASGALGAAVFDVAAPERSHWLISVVEQLSHDLPLPVALQIAAPEGELRMVFADRRLAEKTRVSQRFEHLVERLEAAVPQIPPDPSPRSPRASGEVDASAGTNRMAREDDYESSPGPDRSGDWGTDGGFESPKEPDRSGSRLSGGDLEATEEAPIDTQRSSDHDFGAEPEAPRIDKPIEVRPGSATADRLGLSPGLYSANEMARELAAARGRGYDHETGMASVAAEIAGTVAENESQDAARQPRYILTRILDLSKPDHPAKLTHAFRAGAEHEIRVRIGARTTGWIAPTRATALPEEQLPEDQEDYTLTVIFHEPKLLDEPQVAKIVLPKRGASTVASFRLRVPLECYRVEGRITVAYGNRVLQTALLRGPVGPADPAGENPNDCDGRIETEIEAVVRPGMANLDGRRRFDAALVLNHDADHVPGVTRLADDHISFVASNDIGREIEWFQRRLAQVAYDKSDFTGGLRADATVDLLRSLARHGRQLFKHVVQDQIGDDPLVTAEFIQVIATSDEARLPIEFLYDRKAPVDDPPAPLCPNAEQALADGKCVDACPAGAEEQSVICPLGFWGLKKVLERHAHDPALARSLRRTGNEYAIQSEPREARSPLPVLRGGQLAASQVVDLGCPGGSQRVQQALVQALPEATAAPVATWKDWEAGVETGKQSLLLLLVHTALVDPDDTMQKMEIGQGAWKAVDQLENGTYVATADGPGPLVLLLGCETSAPEVSIHSLVSELRRQGAAIVVSALSKIHAAHAVPVAEEFIEQLAGIEAGNTETFGEVMCRVRRSMLAQGQPMALCLTAYGDADWRLVPDLPRA